MTDEALIPLTPRVLDLPHFRLTPVGLEVKGVPSYDEWAGLGEMLLLFQSGIQWLVGDWMNIGETHFHHLASQVIDHEQWSDASVRVYRWVAEKVPIENRRVAPTFSHGQIVAALPVLEQRKWLEKARDGEDGESWSSGRLKSEIRIAGALPPSLEYGVIVWFDQPSDRDIVAQEHERVGRRVKKIEGAVKKVDENDL